MNNQLQKTSNGIKLKNLIMSDHFKKELANALPRHLTPDRFIRVALTTMQRVPKLAECDQHSFFNALLSLSQYGLEPDGRNAHLIPFKNNSRGCMEVQLIIDYKGLADLVMRSGLVSKIHADVVCENDVFEYDRGEILHHKINFREPRGEAYAAYSLIKMKDGSEKCEVMGKDEIYMVRDKSSGWRAFKKGYGQSPWADAQSEPEMWKKTVFRRVSKWLKLSPELADAIDVEDTGEVRRMDLEVVTDAHQEAVEATSEPFSEPEDDLPMPEDETPQKATKQDDLAEIVTGGGFSFDDYVQFCVQNGDLETDDYPSFDEIPLDVAKRHVRAKVGLLRQLAAVKGGGE